MCPSVCALEGCVVMVRSEMLLWGAALGFAGVTVGYLFHAVFVALRKSMGL